MQSQNGWPALVTSSRLLYSWDVPGADTKLRLRQGFAGFLLVDLATRFDRRIEALHEPILDDWGHAFRPVRGFTVMSNHASGTAMDLNATDHPLGITGTFSAEDRARIQKILARYDGAIRWGGNYNGRKDDMHFEINMSRSAIIPIAKELAQTKRGKLILSTNPSQRKVMGIAA